LPEKAQTKQAVSTLASFVATVTKITALHKPVFFFLVQSFPSGAAVEALSVANINSE